MTLRRSILIAFAIIAMGQAAPPDPPQNAVDLPLRIAVPVVPLAPNVDKPPVNPVEQVQREQIAQLKDLRAKLIRSGAADPTIAAVDQQIAQLEAQLQPPAELPIVTKNFLSDITLKGTIDPLIPDLRSDNFAKRDQAMRTLLHLTPDRLSDVTTALQNEKDAEAIVRLTQVAAHLYLKARTPLDGPASLLGIGLNFEPRQIPSDDPKNPAPVLQSTVAVIQLQPGFPAAQDLCIGDRILSIDGQPVSAEIEGFRAEINRRKPGSSVTFSLLRQGKEMQVQVQLAAISVAGENGIRDAVNSRATSLGNFLNTLKLTIPDDSPLSPKNLTSATPF